jgi:polyferredoxin
VDIPYRMLADLVLTGHFGIVVFVVGAVPLIVLGNVRGWAFVNGPTFRVAHLAAIAVVVGQAWLGVVCPLTTLESWLRAQAGQAGYESSFIEHWLSRILFHDAPGWVFTAAYTLFGLAVAAAWWRFPPRRRA